VFREDGTGRFDVERSMIEFLAENKMIPAPKNGYVEWEGKVVHKEQLARKIETEGRFAELMAFLPKSYEPPVVSSAELEEAA
jgi:hypothetical protein